MTESADLQRLASLSDCVFAVAMTLLAFSVRIPDQGVDPAKLPRELTRMWNESYGLVLSFAITAMFWLGHFRLLRSLSRATVGLIYLNLFQLFWIVVLPISTSLWIRIEERETTIVMEANLTLIALSALLMWVYSQRTGLIEPGALTHPIAVESIVPVFPLLIFAISLLVTFWNPVLGGHLLWGAFATPFISHTGRCRQSSARMPSVLSCATAGGYAAWPSVLITRGVGWFALPSALVRKRLAAAASCLAERRKSRVAPVESTAR
jgi:uncharacterized membrane protein